MKKKMITWCGALLVALGACGHMKEQQTTTAQTTATTATAPRSEAQLAIDDAQAAVQAANDEIARSANSNEAKRLTDIARQKVDQARDVSTEALCRERVMALQAQLNDLQQQTQAQASVTAPSVTAPQPAPRGQAPIVVPHFEVSEAELSPGMKEQLDTAVSKLQGNDSTVVIMGHTDDTGSDEVNQKLSLTRAAAGRDYLISKGIDASRIQIKGAGASAPIAPNDTPEDRAKNRRIEVEITAIKPVS
jgi:outer membrane protein OmpA-like peptidoglycan-associated protein